MDLLSINKQYGGILWSCAKRYHAGIWGIEDVYQQVLITVYTAMQDGKLPTDISSKSQKRVKNFVICRSIDLVRKENRRRTEVVDPTDVHSKVSQDQIESQTEELMSFLSKHLTPPQLEIIMEFVQPSPDVQGYAWNRMIEAQRERKKGKLKMGVKEAVVRKVDIAKHHGVSPATVTRIVAITKKIFTTEKGSLV